jgi:hypothetical protein
MKTSPAASGPARRVSFLLTLLASLASPACFHDTSLQPDASGGAGTSGGQQGGSSDASDPRPHKRIAFNTAGGRDQPFSFNGDIGGLAGGDAKCQAGADYAQLGGAWIAWLSDSRTDAIDRVTSDGPWYTLDGHLAFAHKADLAGVSRAVIEVDQAGAIVAASSYWTGTRLGGTKDVANCKDWTSANDADEGVWGDGRNTAQWTSATHPAGCLGGINLLCLEL